MIVKSLNCHAHICLLVYPLWYIKIWKKIIENIEKKKLLKKFRQIGVIESENRKKTYRLFFFFVIRKLHKANVTLSNVSM